MVWEPFHKVCLQQSKYILPFKRGLFIYNQKDFYMQKKTYLRFFLWLFLITIGFNASNILAIELLVSQKQVFTILNQKKVELGKKLYFDPRLSHDNSLSCNSCHNLMSNGSDSRSHSIGINGQHGHRKAPTVWNVALMSAFFWDGRAKTLEEQAQGPIMNPIEMGMKSEKELVHKLSSLSQYRNLFTEVYKEKNPINLKNIGDAIAEFERTLITYDSPYDHYQNGDKKAMSQAAQRGHKLFQSTGCPTCHQGQNFSGPKLPAGNPFLMKFPLFEDKEIIKKYQITEDKGRFEFTKNEADKNFWRVPSLRNITTTAPYFHNGSVTTLKEAIRVMAKVQLGKTLKDHEISDIHEFLKTLTGVKPVISYPELPYEKYSQTQQLTNK